MRWGARVAFSFVVAAVVACSDRPSGGASSTRMTEALRGLKFRTPPLIETVALADYRRTSTIIPDEEERFLKQTYGRLGFFPFARISPPVSLGGPAPSYDAKSKKLVVVGEPPTELVVFSLVNALEDQHFDLVEFDRGLSTDERLARRALTYGSATEVQARFVFEGESPRGWPTSLSVFNASYAQRSDDAFAQGLKDGYPSVALFFLAEAAFIFSYGAAFVGGALGVGAGAWQTEKVDAMYASPPKSSEEILRGVVRHEPTDPIVDVGLDDDLPPLSKPLRVRYIDRLGAWYVTTLLRQLGVPASTALELGLSWDGDQLAMLVSRAEPDETELPQVHAVVWTSAWDDAGAAQRLVDFMTAPPQWIPPPVPDVCSSPSRYDSPPSCVTREGDRVAFVYSERLGREDLRALARAGLAVRPTPRLTPNRAHQAPPLAIGR